MVIFCWPHGIVVHVPGAPQEDFVQTHFLSVCLKGLIEVLFCWIHDLDVQYAVWSSQIALGPRGGHSLKYPPTLISSLLATEKIVS